MDSNGVLLDVFQIEWSERCLCVLNSPSPSATARRSIAEMICDEWIEKSGV